MKNYWTVALCLAFGNFLSVLSQSCGAQWARNVKAFLLLTHVTRYKRHIHAQELCTTSGWRGGERIRSTFAWCRSFLLDFFVHTFPLINKKNTQWEDGGGGLRGVTHEYLVYNMNLRFVSVRKLDAIWGRIRNTYDFFFFFVLNNLRIGKEREMCGDI